MSVCSSRSSGEIRSGPWHEMSGLLISTSGRTSIVLSLNHADLFVSNPIMKIKLLASNSGKNDVFTAATIETTNSWLELYRPLAKSARD